MRALRELYRSIVSVIKWFPIIWNDRNWDYSYLLLMLEHKLLNMEQYFRNDGHYVGCEKDANTMKKTRLVIKRLIDDQYEDTSFIEYYEKWSDPIFSIDENGRLCLTYAGSNPKQDEQRSSDYRQCTAKMINLQEQDVNYLCDCVRKNLLKWSD